MQFMDVMAPLAAPQGCTKTFNPQHKVGAQFTYPEGMEGWVILKSATSRSWTRAVGVRGECVTTRPPALLLGHLQVLTGWNDELIDWLIDWLIGVYHI